MVTRFRTGDDGSSYTVDSPAHDDFRAMLREQRRFRVQQLRDLDAEPAAPGTALAEVNAALRTAAESALAEVDAALLRLEQGRYGRCVRCDRAIQPERLEILPMAALCMPCQRTDVPGQA